MYNKPFFNKPGMPPVPPMHHDHPHHCDHDHLVAVNPYNKVCFKDKEEAISILLNKDIHPGEVVFAYYYDDDVASGINVVEAVGNLKIGARNMIFESKSDIDKKINGLSLQQGDTAVSIKEIKEQLEDVFNRINVLNSAINSLNDITPVVDSLVSDVEANKAMIDGHDENISVLNTSVNILADAVAEKYKEVSDSISGINDILSEIKGDADATGNATTQVIDELKSSVETWQEQHVAEQQNQFDILDASVIKNINDVKSELNTKVENIKGECIANTDEAIASLNQVIEGLRQTVVSNNVAVDDTVAEAKESILLEIDSKISGAVDPVKADVEHLFDNIHSLEDTAAELDKKYDRIIKDLTVDFDEKIENKAIDTDKKVNDFEKVIDAHKSETTSALEDLETKLTGKIDANMSVMESSVDANATMFRNEINTHKSATEARFETVKSEYTAAIDFAVNDLDVVIKRNANNAEKYCDNAISELRRELIAEITNRIDAIPTYSAAINGGLKCNAMGEFMLDIDTGSNIICYNGRKYILSPYDPTNIG